MISMLWYGESLCLKRHGVFGAAVMSVTFGMVEWETVKASQALSFSCFRSVVHYSCVFMQDFWKFQSSSSDSLFKKKS